MSSSLQAPVILGNAGSSGSTLLANLIGRAPRIYRRNELALFDKRDWLTADVATFQGKWRTWFNCGYARRLGCEMSAVFTDFNGPRPDPRAGEDYLSYLVRFMDDLAVQADSGRWIEKTPANIFAIPILLRRMPEAKFIVIHRDARSVLTSQLRRGFSAPLAAAKWYLANLTALNIAKRDRVMLISYERLIAAPDEVLPVIFAFIGEDFDPKGLERAPASHSTTLKSWRAVPNEGVSTSALWREGDQLPEIAREALTRVRPTNAFLTSMEISDELTPLQVQRELGYPDSEISTGRRSAQLVRNEIKDIARYYASLAYRGLLPRKLPFQFI